MKSGSLLFGLFAGFAAGALIGILYAPDKGTVTRKKISEKGDEYAEELKEKFGDLIDNISRKFEESLQSRKGEMEKTEAGEV